MKTIRTRFISALLVAFLFSTASAFAAQAPVEISYVLSSPEPATHLYNVRMRVENLPADREYLDLSLPVWTPGSYLVREFARNLQDFTTVATAGGQAPRWEKIDKNTWRIYNPGRAVEVAYKIYANEMSVRTSHLDDTHGYVNGANVFMYPEGYKERPVTLRVDVPQGWDVATGMERVPGAQGFVFTAPDYDRLADSPIESGPDLERLQFQALGKPHEIVIWGEGNYDPERLKADFKKIVEETAEIFGNTLPYDRYVFIVHLYPQGGGGLEHLNSTTVEAKPLIFNKKEAYQSFLNLVAHEFFHLWNVKRIRPVALGPFNYDEENYTKMLWLMEGTTSYYAPLILMRAGLMSEDEYWKDLAKEIKSVQETPGRKHLSLEEASFDAWIKYYRRNEHSINDQISYYTKGEVVSAMLDFEIRGRTGGQKTLDDVMRYLWENYALKGVGVPEDAVQKAVEAVAGSSFEEFFDRYIRGTEEIAYDEFLRHMGRRLVTEVRKDGELIEPTRRGGWLGASVADSHGQTVVKAVLEDSPAWDFGINANDELLAVNGVRVTADTLDEVLANYAPGETVQVTVFRRDALRTLPVTLGQRPPDVYRIERIAQAAQ